MRFSHIIKNKAELLASIDPDRIYVENVRSFYNLPTAVAKFLCEMAVKQSYFEKKLAVVCPNDDCRRIVMTVNDESEIPDEVKCDHCELLDRESYKFSPGQKEILVFYKLIR